MASRRGGAEGGSAPGGGSGDGSGESARGSEQSGEEAGGESDGGGKRARLSHDELPGTTRQASFTTDGEEFLSAAFNLGGCE